MFKFRDKVRVVKRKGIRQKDFNRSKFKIGDVFVAVTIEGDWVCGYWGQGKVHKSLLTYADNLYVKSLLRVLNETPTI